MVLILILILIWIGIRIGIVTRGHSLVHHRPHHRVAVDVRPVEERVEIGQQRVADVQVVLGGLHQEGVGSIICRILGLEGLETE